MLMQVAISNRQPIIAVLHRAQHVRGLGSRISLGWCVLCVLQSSKSMQRLMCAGQGG
jgi:hypothetical protein